MGCIHGYSTYSSGYLWTVTYEMGILNYDKTELYHFLLYFKLVLKRRNQQHRRHILQYVLHNLLQQQFENPRHAPSRSRSEGVRRSQGEDSIIIVVEIFSTT